MGRRVSTIARATASVFLVVAVTVAGEATVAAAGKPSPKPCKLLQVSELAEAFGVEIGAPTRRRTGALRVCNWVVPALGERPQGALVVTVVTAKAKYNFRRDSGLADAQLLPELSDDAFYSPMLSAVWLLDGGVLLTVQGLFVRSATIDEGDEGDEIDQVLVRDELVALTELARDRL